MFHLTSQLSLHDLTKVLHCFHTPVPYHLSQGKLELQYLVLIQYHIIIMLDMISFQDYDT